VAQFLQQNGPGVYSVVIRVGDASAAEQVAQRYGAQTRFHQHRGGDGFELDEIELSVLGLPLTLLSTDLP
jgi:4-hydroxyphenylpyruvate dioxygenase-like putative hemolysin